jgi:hypothetical protein
VKLRHSAIATQHAEETAWFYVEIFGLTDGTINLAIRNFKNDQVAGVERDQGWSGRLSGRAAV